MSSVIGDTSGRREHLFRGRRVKVRDLINARLLEPGVVLVYDRPQLGETFQVSVTETGRLRLPDGRETGSLSGAVRQLTGKSRPHPRRRMRPAREPLIWADAGGR